MFTILIWVFTLISFLFDALSAPSKYILCCFPNMALYFAVTFILQYERNEERLTLFKLNTNLFDEHDVNLFVLNLAMLFWSAFFVVLSWYIERIFPGEYGVKLPYNFPFKVIFEKFFFCFFFMIFNHF